VVLATGAHPKELDYPCAQTLPLDEVLDKNKLKDQLEEQDTIALIGGSHSAILILKYLYELDAKRVINFYWHPITYAYDMGNGNVPDYNGLKGDVAQWAFDILAKKRPETILRVKNSERGRESWLPVCNKIIYAIGYERNAIPCADIDQKDLVYDDTMGVVLPRLFGIGIAFPEKIIDPWGKEQHTVGMIDFLEYAQRIVPHWLNNKHHTSKHLHRFGSAFDMYLMKK
jgi:hypothetical protein